MTATRFNPLATARDLEAAGVERRQAEAIAGAVHQAASADRPELATKADIAPLVTKADLRTAIVPFATKADLAAVRWTLAFQGALVLAIAAKLFGIV